MSKRSSRWSVVGLFFALNAAGIVWIREGASGTTLDAVRVIDLTPKEDLSTSDRIRLVFDRRVAGRAELETPIDPEAAPFEIVPSVLGTWQWAAADALEFVFAKEPAPGRRYVIRASEEFARTVGYPLAGSGEFRRTCRPLRVLGRDVVTNDERSVSVRIRFDQPVAPADLRKRLRVVAGREELSVSIAGSEPDAEPVVTVPRPEVETLAITVRAGLSAPGGDLPLEKDVALEPLEVPRRFTSTGWGRGRTDEDPDLAEKLSVSLSFSRDLDPEQAPPRVRVEPAVPGLVVSIGRRSVDLLGDFAPGVPYTATVAGDLLSATREVLGEEERVEFTLPERSPTLRFASSTGVLSPKGGATLDVQVVNVPKVQLTVDRIHPNNVLQHVLEPWSTDRTARTVATRSVRLDLARNRPTTAALDLGSIVGDRPGIYVVRALFRGRWGMDSERITVVVTDLAITVRRERGGLRAWVTSVSGGTPVEGVVVRAVTGKDQVVAEGTTDADGLALLPCEVSAHPDGPVQVVTASREDDLAYLPIDQSDADPATDERTGRPAPRGYDVFLYTERGVYRPGETVHLTAIVRGEDGSVPKPFPLAIAVRRPDGREVGEVVVSPAADAGGIVHADWTAPERCPTGGWRFAARLPGAEETLGAVTAWVEEFVPSRLEVKAATGRERYALGESPRLAVDARWLFDAPAADLPVAVAVEHRPVAYESKRHPGFTFAGASGRTKESPDEVRGALDAEGRAAFDLPAPSSASPGLWRTTASATVTEPGGRSTSVSAACDVDTLGRHLGLRLPARVVPTATPVACDWVLLTGEDEGAEPKPFDLALFRVEEKASIRYDHGRAVWRRTEREVLADRWTVEAAAAHGSREIRCARPGLYRLRATDPSTKVSTEVDLYASADVAADAAVPESADQVEVVLDQERYAPGATARVTVRSPFAGTLLLTLESAHIRAARVVAMPTPSATLDLPVPADLRGGGVVVATVVRGVDASRAEWLPHRARGAARLAVDHGERKVPVALEAEASVRPGEVAHVVVRTGTPSDPAAPGRVHLWAVDDGILRTTGYALPDPHGHFFAARRHEVASGDTYEWLLPDVQRPADMASIGGDDGGEDALQRSPVPAQRRLSAVVWRTAVPLDADGTAQFDLPTPETTGRLRLLAVVVDGDRYGSGERTVTLASPLQVEASLPRFLALGDRVFVPVRLFDTTDGPLEATLGATVDGYVSVQAPAPEAPLPLAPGRSATAWRTLVGSVEGRASLRLSAEGRAPDGTVHRASQDLDLPVRSAAAPDVRVRFLTVPAGEEVSLEFPDDLRAQDGWTEVTVGGRPSVSLDALVAALRDYPFDCCEQRSSRLLALLQVPHLMEGAGAKQLEEVRAEAAGLVRRLWADQLSSGAMSLWGGSDREAREDVTAWCGQVLAAARKEGIEVDDRFVRPLCDHLETLLRSGETEDVDDDLRARACHVLASFGRPPIGWMTALAERVSSMGPAGRADLAEAWAEAGRREDALRALAAAADAVAVRRPPGRGLDTSLGGRARLLHALVSVDPANPALAPLARELDEGLREGAWWNTAEQAAALAALTALARTQPAPEPFTGTLEAAGLVTPFTSDAALRIRVPAVVGPFRIRVEGKGAASVALTSKGRRVGPTPAHDRRLFVRRAWFDRRGKPVDPAAFRVGDLVEVRVTLSTTEPRTDPFPTLAPNGPSVDDVAIVDALPACLEVENPRLANTDALSRSSTTPDRTEFLDDRVLLFASAGPEPRTWSWFVRVIAAGSFEQPSITASAMYDPSFSSASGGGRVEVAR